MSTSSVRMISKERDAALPYQLAVNLSLDDPESIRELMAYEEGDARNEFAVSALRIGLLALRQARGQIDGETVKREGDRLLAGLQNQLDRHGESVNESLTRVLKDYFDPESGRFNERVQRLLKKDGELEAVIRRQVGVEDSELCKTLALHVGQSSPIFKILNPKDSESILNSMGDTLNAALKDQRDRVIGEFSLDRADSALSRLVKKLTESHGKLGEDLQVKIDDVMKEFSLDKEDSALSRLVENVSKAQKTISSEFSLDNEHSALSKMSRQLKSTSDAIDNQLTLDKDTSALSRLKRELIELLKTHSETTREFQNEVKQTLEAMKIRKEQARRTTLHGLEFEQQVCEFLQRSSQCAGHIVEFLGNTTGQVKGSKVGDVVIALSDDHAAGGARIVLEAKDKKGYSLTSAREELDQAKKNRGANVGVFVFARTNAPSGLHSFQRYGDDLVVIWDSEDNALDLYLDAAVMVAQALCTRQAKQRETQTADFMVIDKAINEIEKQSVKLDEIRAAADTINKQTDIILNRVRIDTKSIAKNVETLREHVEELKTTLSTPLPEA